MMNVSRLELASAWRAFRRPAARTPEVDEGAASLEWFALRSRAARSRGHIVSDLLMAGEFDALDRLLADLDAPDGEATRHGAR